MLKEADEDKDGQITLDNLINVMQDTIKKEKANQRLRMISCVLILIMVLLIGSMAAMSAAVAVAFKDSYTNGDTHYYVDKGNYVLRTAPSEYMVPLIAAPVLPLTNLKSIQTMVLTLADTNDEEYSSVKRVASVQKYSETRLTFSLEDGHVLRVWDGEAYLVRPICVDPTSSELDAVVGDVEDPKCIVTVCESNVTCAALMVEDASSAQALTDKAYAALDAAGFTDDDEDPPEDDEEEGGDEELTDPARRLLSSSRSMSSSSSSRSFSSSSTTSSSSRRRWSRTRLGCPPPPALVPAQKPEEYLDELVTNQLMSDLAWTKYQVSTNIQATRCEDVTDGSDCLRIEKCVWDDLNNVCRYKCQYTQKWKLGAQKESLRSSEETARYSEYMSATMDECLHFKPSEHYGCLWVEGTQIGGNGAEVVQMPGHCGQDCPIRTTFRQCENNRMCMWVGDEGHGSCHLACDKVDHFEQRQYESCVDPIGHGSPDALALKAVCDWTVDPSPLASPGKFKFTNKVDKDHSDRGEYSPDDAHHPYSGEVSIDPLKQVNNMETEWIGNKGAPDMPGSYSVVSVEQGRTMSRQEILNHGGSGTVTGMWGKPGGEVTIKGTGARRCFHSCSSRPDRATCDPLAKRDVCVWDECSRTCSDVPHETVVELDHDESEEDLTERNQMYTTCSERQKKPFYNYTCTGEHSYCWLIEPARSVNDGSGSDDGSGSEQSAAFSAPPMCMPDCMAINKLAKDTSYGTTSPRFPGPATKFYAKVLEGNAVTAGAGSMAKAKHFCSIEPHCTWNDSEDACEWVDSCDVSWPEATTMRTPSKAMKREMQKSKKGLVGFTPTTCVQATSGGESGISSHGRCENAMASRSLKPFSERVPMCTTKCELRASKSHCLSPGEGGRISEMGFPGHHCSTFPKKMSPWNFTGLDFRTQEYAELKVVQDAQIMPQWCMSHCTWDSTQDKCYTSCEARKTEAQCSAGSGCKWDESGTVQSTFFSRKIQGPGGTGVGEFGAEPAFFNVPCTGQPAGPMRSVSYRSLQNEVNEFMQSDDANLKSWLERNNKGHKHTAQYVVDVMGYDPDGLGAISHFKRGGFNGPVSNCIFDALQAEPYRSIRRIARSCYSSVKLQMTDRHEQRRGEDYKPPLVHTVDPLTDMPPDLASNAACDKHPPLQVGPMPLLRMTLPPPWNKMGNRRSLQDWAQSGEYERVSSEIMEFYSSDNFKSHLKDVLSDTFNNVGGGLIHSLGCSSEQKWYECFPYVTRAEMFSIEAVDVGCACADKACTIPVEDWTVTTSFALTLPEGFQPHDIAKRLVGDRGVGKNGEGGILRNEADSHFFAVGLRDQLFDTEAFQAHFPYPELAPSYHETTVTLDFVSEQKKQPQKLTQCALHPEPSPGPSPGPTDELWTTAQPSPSPDPAVYNYSTVPSDILSEFTPGTRRALDPAEGIDESVDILTFA